MRRRLGSAQCCELPHSLRLSVLTTESFTTPYMTRLVSPCFSGKSPVLLFFLSYNPDEKMKIPFRSLTVAIEYPVGFPVHLLGPVHHMTFLYVFSEKNRTSKLGLTISTPNNGGMNTIKILLEPTGMSLPMETRAITTKDPITSGSPHHYVFPVNEYHKSRRHQWVL